MVSFNQIPQGWKLPGASIEVDPSQAGTPTNPKWGLIPAIKLAAGSAPANIPIAVGTQADADAYGGAGSMLAAMFRRWFQINKSTPLYVLPVAEPSGGVAASGTITVASAPTSAGTLALYIAGQKVTVGIGSSDTTAQVATKINAAINAATDLPVTSTVSTNVVTVTAKWKGVTGNDIRLEDNFLGVNGAEVMPAGLALTYPTNNVLASGTGTPDLTTAIANIGDAPFKFVGFPFTDSGSLAAIALEYGFSDSGRWGWMRQSYGQVFSARRDSYANHMTWGPTSNFPVTHVLGVELQAPSPPWEWAAAFAAQAAKALTNDPARPLQTLTLDGILSAPKAFRFNKTQLNAMAGVGLAIQGTDVDGQQLGVPQLLREQSQYQKNTQGQADNAYELATTLATLDEIFTRLRQAIGNRFPRSKLANDGMRLAPGQAVVTPKIIKSELIAEYGLMEYDGLVENMKAFKDALVVERSSTDPNAVEVLYPPDLINQLRRLNIRAAFRLQFPTSAAA